MSQHFKKGSVGAILIALIAIVLLGWAIWYINTHEEEFPGVDIPNPVATSTSDANLKTYQSTEAGYSFKYPKDFSLKQNADVNELGVYAQGTSLTFPESYFKNTTISPTQTHISFVATSSVCSTLILKTEGSSGGSLGTTTINGIPFAGARFGGGAAGHAYESNAYYATRSGLCYLIVLTTDTINPGNYGGTQAEIATKTAANIETRKVLVTAFETIAKTFTFLSAPEATTVKIPLLVDLGNTKFDGKVAACDKLVYVTKTIPATAAPLTAVISELFNGKYPWPYSDTAPGNFVATQKKISFEKVVTEGSVAKIYLKGEGGPLNGVCDEPRMRFQLEDAALQFPAIKSVEFYLNDKKTPLMFNENE